MGRHVLKFNGSSVCRKIIREKKSVLFHQIQLFANSQWLIICQNDSLARIISLAKALARRSTTACQT